MERLIAAKLIYGGLVPIDRPHLVERYNAALSGLGLPGTHLHEFSVDATGFSPEVAAETGNQHYLDPHGVNRRFIILTPDQAHAPVVNINFSSTIEYMRRFFSENAEAINTLTLKDVIYGEIDNSTYRIGDVEDILSIKTVRFNVHTANRLLAKAERLQTLLDRFHAEPDGWRDETLINQIVDLARKVGDIRVNAIIPRSLTFEQRSFWTRHFGGLFVFHDENGTQTVIGKPEKPEFTRQGGEMDRYISMSAPRRVYDFLARSGRLDPPSFDWLESTGTLDRRIDYIVRDATARIDPQTDIMAADQTWIRNWIYTNYDELSANGVFPFLQSLRKQAFNRRQPKLDARTAHLSLIITRAPVDHPDKLLINRLLSEFVPFDFLTRYLVNKEAFYADYEGFPEGYRAYVVDQIQHHLTAGQGRLWSRLFDEA